LLIALEDEEIRISSLEDLAKYEKRFGKAAADQIRGMVEAEVEAKKHPYRPPTKKEKESIIVNAGIKPLGKAYRSKYPPDSCKQCGAAFDEIASFEPAPTGWVASGETDAGKLLEVYSTLELRIMECPAHHECVLTHEVGDYEYWTTVNIDRSKLRKITILSLVCGSEPDECKENVQLSADLARETAEEGVNNAIKTVVASGWTLRHRTPQGAVSEYCPNHPPKANTQKTVNASSQ
jgi:hypothetical protein